MSGGHGAVAGCAMKVGISSPGIKIDTLLALHCHSHSLINRIYHKYGGNATKNMEVWVNKNNWTTKWCGKELYSFSFTHPLNGPKQNMCLFIRSSQHPTGHIIRIRWGFCGKKGEQKLKNSIAMIDHPWHH